MRDNRSSSDYAILWLIPAVLLLLIGILMASCRSIEYVPVEKVRYEYVTRDSIRMDSIHVRDSVYIREKGDTVFKDKYKYIYEYKYINKTDTVIRTDSIPVPYPVEKQLSRWEKMKLDFGGMAAGFLAVSLGLAILWIVIKRR